MRSFYRSTHYFWVVFRVIMIVAYCISAMSVLNEHGRLHSYEMLVNIVIFFYAVGLIILSVQEIAKKPQNIILRRIVGVFSILLALTIAVVIVMFNGRHGGLLIFPVIILFFGLWDMAADL